ncbi:two component transcriptional regulator, LuxR family [Dehalogenimonas alkenigignens]|uniref:Two component transcriptional regulator, LuxR family n=1 Tax=Dehalogenimonas alkenigignens TaxID=1217799 RepID=A0A0W0GIB9_9CHLR|nr:response regulator transcription factor [Dehalogenimonas alkenigignens]KTB48317.1 two component transcriptional regulator, LuxR family [Dehalogenimonas alkenigignens]
MKVLLVDDNRLMIEGLQNMLDAHGIEVAGTATDGLQSLELVRRLKPDVVLMDIRMPLCDGLCATRLIKAEMPESRIVILTTSTEETDLFEAIKAGACGYLLKSMDASELVEALEQANLGVPPFSPNMAMKLLNEFARLSNKAQPEIPASQMPKAPIPESKLNPREIEVLKFVAAGLTYKEVGARLNLSPRTIKYHMSEIMARLHLENRAQVLAFAGQSNLWSAQPKK